MYNWFDDSSDDEYDESEVDEAVYILQGCPCRYCCKDQGVPPAPHVPDWDEVADRKAQYLKYPHSVQCVKCGDCCTSRFHCPGRPRTKEEIDLHYCWGRKHEQAPYEYEVQEIMDHYFGDLAEWHAIADLSDEQESEDEEWQLVHALA